VLALALSAVPAVGKAQAGWVCTTEKMTGFSKSSGEWMSVDFETRPKYVIKRGVSGKPAWEVRIFQNEGFVQASCPEEFSRLEVLHCSGLETVFKFNRKTGRFLNAYLAGYWSYTPNAPFFSKDGGDSPTIEIGTCSPL